VAFSHPRNDGNETPSYRNHLADRKRQTRRRILNAARRVFLEQGFLDANLNEVAAQAGVGKGTLYRHFENKGELYVAMLSEHAGELPRALARAVDPDAPAPEQLSQVAHYYLSFWQRYPEYFQIVWAVQNRDLIGPLSSETSEHLRDVFERPLRVFEALIRKGIAAGELRAVDPWNTANALALATNSIVGQMVSGVDQVVERDLDAVYRQFQDVVLNGLVAADRRSDGQG
jgi:AcrR family transcriptional regulator